jgi:hypothetical protein
MQYYGATLKNDAILVRAIKKRCNISARIKNDAILVRALKNDAIHLVIKGSMGSRPRSVSGSAGGVRGHKVRGHKNRKNAHNRGVRLINDATSMHIAKNDAILGAI